MLGALESKDCNDNSLPCALASSEGKQKKAAKLLCADFYLPLKECFSILTEKVAGNLDLKLATVSAPAVALLLAA